MNAFAALDTPGCDRRNEDLRFCGVSDFGFWSAEEGGGKRPSTVSGAISADWVMPPDCNRRLTKADSGHIEA